MIVYISRQLIIHEGKRSTYFYKRIIIATVLLFLFLIFEICILLDKIVFYSALIQDLLSLFTGNDWVYESPQKISYCFKGQFTPRIPENVIALVFYLCYTNISRLVLLVHQEIGILQNITL